MSDEETFASEVRRNVEALAGDAALQGLSNVWLRDAARHRYSYNFRWLGRPVIQMPQDIVAMQEILWEVRPRLVVETGVARGGSLILYASLLELIGGDGLVAGVDVEIRPANREAIEAHPLARRIRLIEGSSVDPAVVARVADLARERAPVVVVLDSNHTHDHVLRELSLYSPFVGKGSYLVVFDTIIEHVPEDLFAGRPWRRGNSPGSAVREFLGRNPRFEADAAMDARLLLSTAPGGYLRCVGD